MGHSRSELPSARNNLCAQVGPSGEIVLKSFKGCSVNIKLLALLKAQLLPSHLCSSSVFLPAARQAGTVSHVIDMLDRTDQNMRGYSCTLLNLRANDTVILIRALDTRL